MARSAVIGLHADGAKAGDVPNVLAEALGMMLATISPDAGGLQRNVEMFSAQMELFAQAYWREKQGLPRE